MTVAATLAVENVLVYDLIPLAKIKKIVCKMRIEVMQQ
jgi:hypothetical protein